MELITTDKPAHEGFAAIVADALIVGGIPLPEQFVTGAVERIDGAHQVRVRMLQHELADEKRAVGAFAAMDVANAKVMQYAKMIIGQALEVNSRQSAYAESMAEMRAFLRALLDRAQEGQDVTAEDLQKLTEWPVCEVPGTPPFVVGMAVDPRYVYGDFKDRNNGRGFRMSFLGWSLVVHNPPFHSTLEPTFLSGADMPKTRLDLLIDGYELLGLH